MPDLEQGGGLIDPNTGQIRPEMIDFWNQLTPDEQEAFKEGMSTDYAGRGTELDTQMQRAEALRGTQLPTGFAASGDKPFVASSPLEMAGAVGMQYQGQQQMQKAMAEQERLRKMKEATQATANQFLGF